MEIKYTYFISLQPWTIGRCEKALLIKWKTTEILYGKHMILFEFMLLWWIQNLKRILTLRKFISHWDSFTLNVNMHMYQFRKKCNVVRLHRNFFLPKHCSIPFNYMWYISSICWNLFSQRKDNKVLLSGVYWITSLGTIGLWIFIQVNW